LNALISEIRADAIRQISTELKLPAETVAAVERGDVPADLPVKGVSKNLPAATRRELESLDRGYLVDRIRSALETNARVSFNIDYANGYTFQTNDVDQLINILETEPDPPVELTVSVGGWAGTRLRLTVGGKLGSVARYTLEGARRDVDSIGALVRNLLRASQPESAWLHRPSTSYALRLFVILVFVGAYIYAIRTLAITRDQWVGALWFAATVGVVASALASIPIKQLKIAYPSCQFDFGLERKRRSARRSVIWAVLSVLAIPILISWIFAR
jgi:hypothetical protein